MPGWIFLQYRHAPDKFNNLLQICCIFWLMAVQSRGLMIIAYLLILVLVCQDRQNNHWQLSGLSFQNFRPTSAILSICRQKIRVLTTLHPCLYLDLFSSSKLFVSLIINETIHLFPLFSPEFGMSSLSYQRSLPLPPQSFQERTKKLTLLSEICDSAASQNPRD